MGVSIGPSLLGAISRGAAKDPETKSVLDGLRSVSAYIVHLQKDVDRTARAAKLERELALNYPEGPKRVRGATKAARVASGREIPPTPTGQGGPATSVAGTDFLATPSRTATTRPASPPPPRSRKEIRVGMTSSEVETLLGPPRAEIAFGAKTRWTYADLTVVFEAGKVRDVQF